MNSTPRAQTVRAANETMVDEADASQAPSLIVFSLHLQRRRTLLVAKTHNEE